MSAYDALVIGAGLVGTAVAFRLAQEGLHVALLEKNTPGREASWAGAGMLTPAPDSSASIPLVPFGRASLGLYPQFIAELEEISERKTGFRNDGAIELLFGADAERELSTLVALHHALNLPTEPLPLDEVARMEPAVTRRARAAAYFPYEACVDNRGLVETLLSAALASGVKLIPNANVSEILIEQARCIGVRTADGTVLAAHEVIVAAGAFSGLLKGIVPALSTRPIRGQMVALHSQHPICRVVRCERGYIVPRDSGSPQRVVTGSTLEDAGFNKGVTAGGVESILSTAQELVPKIASAEIAEIWCGLRPDTPDHLPLLGPAGVPGLTIATGHYRNGILLTPITAKLVREWVVDKRVSMDWDIFSPMRFAERANIASATELADPSGGSQTGSEFARK